MDCGSGVPPLPEWPHIKDDFLFWLEFLRRNIVFDYPESVIHNEPHCARVLLHAIRIAHARGLGREDVTALCMASVFHDCGRTADGLDTGHGERSAKKYRKYCAESGLFFDERAYLCIFFHDRPDASGRKAFLKNGLEAETYMYDIFKDSDGLDRLRLGDSYLDVGRLRTEEAVGMVDFAGSICRMSPDELIRALSDGQ